MMKIRSLTAIDLSAAQRLREQAGWNQTDDDWRRLLAWSPDGCWAAELDGQVVGTTTVTAFGRRIAWIGMVLVDEAHRRQGIGRALLSHAIAYLERLGVQTIALDSTPEGQPLYARLGFVDAFELARWRGPIPSPEPGARPDWPPPTKRRGSPRAQGAGPRSVDEQAEAASRPDEAVVRPFEPADLAAVAAYDARLFGADRAHILGAQFGGHPARCFVAERREQIVGYVLSRPGARAWHLGPLAADHPTTAERLARMALLTRAEGESWGVGGLEAGPSEMVMDVVMPNRHAVTLADALGLAQVRRFIRMTRGASPPAVDDARLYTSAGPELG
jgi:predicted N-acetyltransferase YhbS